MNLKAALTLGLIAGTVALAGAGVADMQATTAPTQVTTAGASTRTPNQDHSRAGDTAPTAGEGRYAALARAGVPEASTRPAPSRGRATEARREAREGRPTPTAREGELTYHGPTQCFEDGSCREDGHRMLSPAQVQQVMDDLANHRVRPQDD